MARGSSRSSLLCRLSPGATPDPQASIHQLSLGGKRQKNGIAKGRTSMSLSP